MEHDDRAPRTSQPIVRIYHVRLYDKDILSFNENFISAMCVNIAKRRALPVYGEAPQVHLQRLDSKGLGA